MRLGRPCWTLSGRGARGAAACAAVFVALLAAPRRGAAQIISPGKLSAPHADLEGMGNCTRCHRLRQQGSDPSLCLSCHRSLEARIRAGEGFHARVDGDCSVCHKEHFGRDFLLVRLDTAAFPHERTGYALEGKHREVGCRECHTPARVEDAEVRKDRTAHAALDRTFLGLPTACASCHGDDDPHAGQFAGRTCRSCHDASGWDRAPGFDHRRAGFALTGKHAQVACSGCHASEPGADGRPVTRYRPVASGGCATCHRDPHAGAMPGTCERCHTTAGWDRLQRGGVERGFDHGTTGFALVARHAKLACASCHDRAAATRPGIRLRFASRVGAYPPPEAESCLSCHQDPHDGVFRDQAGGGDCAGCHGQRTWLPAAWGPERHGDTDFPLKGAHVTVPCGSCHRPDGDTLVLRMDDRTCAACHGADDPHDGQFPGRACDACHTEEGFALPSFDHARTGYVLDGAHADVPCASCHRTEPGSRGQPVVRWTGLGTRCVDCHEGVRR